MSTFDLQPSPREPGAWRGRTADRTWVTCAGGPDGPDPERLAALEDVVRRLDEVLDEVRRWAAGRPQGGFVPFERRPDECFDFRICGLDGPMAVLLVDARGTGTPGVVVLHVSTGLPDGYADYRVTLHEGRPVGVTAWV